RAGLVERTRDEGDRRIVWVRLSAEGVRQFTEAGRIRRVIMAELFAPLTPEEAQQLVYLYEKVAGSIADPGSEMSDKE
ncbi:MAG TPA: hypothetical protein VNT01_00210, partial [Symbiobacteriaceae bacterium]|nr:hypothetical protein [Symbiobacteriaceae bacterium]